MSGHARIVLGVSDSLPGLQALRFAVAEGRRRQMPVHAVRVWPIPPPTRTSSGFVWRDDLTAETRRYVTEAFDAAVGGMPDDVTITVAWCSGRIDTALKQAVGEADLLVLGSAHRWHLSRTVRACTRDPRCPVVIVPPPALARTLRWTSLRRLFRDIAQHK